VGIGEHMDFKEWNRENNYDGLNAGNAWDAALEEAAKLCDERFKVIDQDTSGDNEYFYLDELENAAKAIRALKRSPR